MIWVHDFDDEARVLQLEPNLHLATKSVSATASKAPGAILGPPGRDPTLLCQPPLAVGFCWVIEQKILAHFLPCTKRVVSQGGASGLDCCHHSHRPMREHCTFAIERAASHVNQ